MSAPYLSQFTRGSRSTLVSSRLPAGNVLIINGIDKTWIGLDWIMDWITDRTTDRIEQK